MFKGKTMPIFLPEEYETEVYGNGSGFIVIQQKQESETLTIFLSVHQFETIFNHEKRIMKEAYESNDSSDSNEDFGQS